MPGLVEEPSEHRPVEQPLAFVRRFGLICPGSIRTSEGPHGLQSGAPDAAASAKAPRPGQVEDVGRPSAFAAAAFAAAVEPLEDVSGVEDASPEARLGVKPQEVEQLSPGAQVQLRRHLGPKPIVSKLCAGPSEERKRQVCVCVRGGGHHFSTLWTSQQRVWGGGGLSSAISLLKVTPLRGAARPLGGSRAGPVPPAAPFLQCVLLALCPMCPHVAVAMWDVGGKQSWVKWPIREERGVACWRGCLALRMFAFSLDGHGSR
mmetsp:Transcript_65282/g.147248  ORF Transcript_65282/g.147248 Transcript_65282/m.147248 type:complete len:261 (-) Transcript_65282:20-802(-)